VLDRSRRGEIPTGCGHVGAEAETRDVDEQVVRTEIVENVALRLVGEDDVARHSHEQATDETHPCRCVGDGVESDVSSAFRLISYTDLSSVGVSIDW